MKRSEYAYSSSRSWFLYSGNTVKISWQLERPFLKYSVLSISKLSEKQYSGNRHLEIKALNHEKVNIIKLLKSLKINLFSIRFFFFLSFYLLSQTLAIRRTAEEGREPSFIPRYHFHPLMNIQTFISNFACEMRLLLSSQTASRWDLPPYWITIWLIDWWCNFCLFTWWFGSRLFVTAISHGKPVDLNSHRLLPLNYKRTD